VAILDDGFQHRRLRRDLDILLTTPDHLASNARLFPEGVLRETPDGARRADIIGGFDADWRDGAGTRPDFTFSLFPTHLEARLGETHPIERLRDKRVFLLSAIARPERVERSVRELGACLAGHAAYRDHHRFTSRELKSVMKRARHKGASYIVTTEKDWVRGLGLWEKTDPQVVALVTRLDIASGENVLMKVVTETLRK
jgi:tetraacyldisaccharide 4'-kinase